MFFKKKRIHNPSMQTSAAEHPQPDALRPDANRSKLKHPDSKQPEAPKADPTADPTQHDAAQAELMQPVQAEPMQPGPARSTAPAAEEQLLMDVRGVERVFQVGSRKLHVLKGIDMQIKPKQLVMLRGRSGSGKTTLLNLIGGLDEPTKGEIFFKGRPFHRWNDQKRTLVRRKEIGFIFQTYALLPLLSAWENVELSLRMAGYPKKEWKSRVAYCLEQVGLGKRMHHRPFELSGGEQQRVAIAKAIAHRPSLILADEPTAELDSQMGAQIMAVFREIIEKEDMAICMTTHDPTILEVADHVYEMVDGKFKS